MGPEQRGLQRLGGGRPEAHRGARSLLESSAPPSFHVAGSLVALISGNYIMNGLMSRLTCASLTGKQPDEGRVFICWVLGSKPRNGPK